MIGSIEKELMKNKQDRAILQQGLAESYENAIENKNKIITDIVSTPHISI